MMEIEKRKINGISEIVADKKIIGTVGDDADKKSDDFFQNNAHNEKDGLSDSISVQGLTAFYKTERSMENCEKKPVLKDISLEIKKGELTCLCGLNGCGKSTLLSIISGLGDESLEFSAEKGPVVCGKKIASLKRAECASLISFMPQSEESTWEFTVRDVIEMGLYARKTFEKSTEAENIKKIDEIMKELGIFQLADKSVHQISGGEYQKVRVARAVVQSDDFLILDEPCANLDFCYEEELLEYLRNLAEKKHMGILITIHNINAAAHFANKIMLLPKGGKIISGTTEECWNEENLKKTFGKDFKIWTHPVWNCPQV